MAKFTLLVALCAIAIAVSSGRVLKEHKVSPQNLVKFLSKHLEQELLRHNGPQPLISIGSILPKLDDPLVIGDTSFDFDSDSFKGQISLFNAQLVGGDNIEDNADIEIEFNPSFALTVDISLIRLEGRLNGGVNLDLDGIILDLKADGAFYVELRNFQATLLLTLEVFEVDSIGNFKILDAKFDWSLGTLAIDIKNTTGNGEPVNWVEFTPIVRGVIDNLWEDRQAEVNELIHIVLSQVTESCNILTMVTGDTSCLNLPFSFGGDDIPADVNEYLIYSENITSAGDWGSLDRCPTGSFAQGFALKIEEAEQLDDTAVNAVKFFCGPTESSPSVTSLEGESGDYYDSQFCAEGGYINGFQLRSEEDIEVLDDAAANNFRAYCSSDSLIAVQGPNEHVDGQWRSVLKCASDFGVCGIKTQVEEYQGPFSDDSALNNVAVLCCRR